ncbi:hypothetical protein DEU56DRAFT_915118 [Suillus clintonianus]|uniref:uncharacterized protein n=1 Tax=Suillus clintonianus TaxID=1904413 RepID=UPI001B87ECDC|nr:uncharacterized protein DEU56DRAFT_915118 [Suillus clintonianus]KAG2129617.1 hypothetical protein DEU56DRAFT_915118 [Suillus clintonianus]
MVQEDGRVMTRTCEDGRYRPKSSATANLEPGNWHLLAGPELAKALLSMRYWARQFYQRELTGQPIHYYLPLSILTLSAPCVGRACTSVQTEIIYEDLPPSTWRASIKFIEKDEWKKTLHNLVDDISAVCEGDPLNIARGNRDDFRPALDAWDILQEECLGLSPPEPSVWHLVDSVRIYGAFDVLASGAVTLVDVPGFGDANKTRTKRTKEYLKNVEVVILVADIKRAADDQAMHDYFEKFLHQMIAIDGRIESLLVVLTGADVRINEDQLHHLGLKQRQTIQKMRQEIVHLSESLHERGKLYHVLCAEFFVAPIDHPKFMELKSRVKSTEEMRDKTASQLQLARAAKDTYIAHQRSARARDVFLRLYRQVYCSIKQDSASEPPPLPIFCIGSMDYTQLLVTNKEDRAPVVFTDLEDTGIPQLCRYIHDFGSRTVISDITTHAHKSTLLWEEIESYFLSSRRDSRLTAYEDAARGLVEALKDAVDETLKTSGAKLDNNMNELEQALRIEAEKAAERSLKIIKTLGENHQWRSYRSLMRRQGEWRSVDLNEDLAHGILEGSASSAWHRLFNDFLKTELRSLIVVISNHFNETIQSIKNRAQRTTAIAPHIDNACNFIHPSDTIDPAREQEFSGSLKGLLRAALEDHYHVVGRESGAGTFQRMKRLNEERFSPRKAQELYARVIDQVMTAVRMARNRGEAALDEALARLYATIDRSLVCVQGDDQICKVTRRNMQKFLDEEYSAPLAVVMAIMGRYKERDTQPIEAAMAIMDNTHQ